jgi:hypothetical protein
MNSFLTWILTSSRFLRWLVNLTAGTLAGWGVVAEDDTSIIAAALLAIVNAILTQILETKKDEDAKQVQAALGTDCDGWAGPETLKAARRRTGPRNR